MSFFSKLSHNALVKSAVIGGVCVSSLLILSKGYVWWKTGSVAIQASLFDSLLDVCASILNIWAIHFSLRPADAEHRFGHGKIEALASLAQSLVIAVSTIWIIFHGFNHLSVTHVVDVYSPILISLLIFCLLLTLALVIWQKYVIKRTRSLVIAADTLHYWGDFLVNLGSFVGFLCLPFSNKIDIFVGVCIAFYILWNAWKLIRKAFDILIDRELDDITLSVIERLAFSNSQVRDVHELRTRSSGYTDFIQLHLGLDPTLTLRESHDIAEDVALRIQKEFPQAEVLIHQDPYPQEEV